MKNLLITIILICCASVVNAEPSFDHWNTAQAVSNIKTMKTECRAYADTQVPKLATPVNDTQTNLSIKLYMLCVEEWFITRPDIYNNHF